MQFISKTALALSLCATLSSSLFADDTTVSQAELQSFTAQKYHVDFNARTDKEKTDITNEYTKSVKLADTLLSGSIKDDIDFKVAQRQIAIEIWAQKFLASSQVDDATVKALYDKYQPNITPAYKLRNILVNSEAKVESIMKALSKIKDPTKRLTKFKEFVKSDSEDMISRKNEGDTGWIDINKFDPSVATNPAFTFCIVKL